MKVVEAEVVVDIRWGLEEEEEEEDRGKGEAEARAIGNNWRKKP